MARLSVRLLGSFHVALDGQAVTGFTSDKARALLAYLAVEAGRPQRREALAGLLWLDYPQSSARASLRSALLAMRQAIGDREKDSAFLHISRQTIQFDSTSDAWVDVSAFTDLLQPKLPDAQTPGRLEEAVALYRGDFLAGFSLPDSAAFEEWALLTREQMRRLAVEALDELVDRYEATGEYEAALPHAWRQVELDPWRERAQRQLMRLLTLSGQRGAALAQYEVCRHLLAQELGAEPAPETVVLYECILNGEIAAPAEAVGLPPHNLPCQPTPFVARETDLACIGQRLEDPACRLLTLVGPGGSGKTRLALQAAAGQLDRYPHGVFFVSLASVNSAGSILPSVADAIGFTFYEGGEPRQQLLDYLRGKRMLLVMDNYEHLLEPSLLAAEASSSEGFVNPAKRGADGSTQPGGGAALVTDILRAAPGLKILATSRARLNVGGEHRYPISGMLYPDPETAAQAWEHATGSARYAQDHLRRRAAPVAVQVALQYSAVKLFLQGARRAKPGFELGDENLSAVVHICRLVEGMPLAIRLAASWVAMLSPGEIASELGRNLDLLATDRRDVPQRQRSVRATLDYTWRLLTERERELMQRLSIFCGGFTREAAQAVAAASLRQLMALADKSLLQPTVSGRYEIHELSRQYARERLDRAPDGGASARDRHCAYYAAALRQWGAELKGARQQTALAEIEAEVENVTAAWNRAVEQGDAARLDQALEGLCRFYSWRGRFQEGMAVCRAAANVLREEVRGDRHRVRVRILVWESSFCRALGHTHLANKHVENCLGLLDTTDLDTRAERASVLAQMGGLASGAGDNTRARRLFDAGLNLYQALGDRWGEAAALEGLGYVAWSVSANDEAKRRAKESLALRQALGDKRGSANSLELMGLIAAYSGQVQESVRLRRDIVAMRTEIGDRPGIAFGLFNLATGLLWSGELAGAQALLEESLERYADLGSRGGVAQDNAFLGWIDALHGRYEQARIRIENSLLEHREMGRQQDVARALLFRGMLTLAEGDYAACKRLSTEAVDLYRQSGQRDECALAIAALGYAARAQGAMAQARSYLCQALQTGAELHATGLIIMPVPTAALLLADAGEKELAVEIYALAKRHPYVARSRFYEEIVGKQIAAVAATLPPEVVAAAQERGRARDLWATAAELSQEFKSCSSKVCTNNC